MNDRYIFQKPPRRSHYSAFRARLKILIGAMVLIGVIAAFIYVNLKASPKVVPQTSPEQNITISTPMQTFVNQYFKFSDTGKWVLDKATTANKIVYIEYHGEEIQGQLDVYVNQVPIPLYLAVPRVLPVRLINDNSFQVTGVSDPCGDQYGTEPHREKDVTINGATMLCDPDNPQYEVVVGQIGGDYLLHLKRTDGTPISFVIIYLDQKLDPDPQTIVNIAGSFQAL